MFANLWKKVSLSINGTEIPVSYDYELVHYVMKLLTIKKKDLDYELTHNGFYITEIKYLPATGAFATGTGQQLIQHPLVDVPTKKIFTTAPEWDINEFISWFNKGKIPTSDDTKIMTGKVPHPLFGNKKNWPPECPLTLQFTPNNINKLVYCKEGFAPTLLINKITFNDTIIHVTDEMVDQSVRDTILSGSGFEMPFTKYETNFYNLQNGTDQSIQLQTSGNWPSMAIFGFIPTGCRTDTKASTQKFMSKFPPLLSMTVFNGEREYPEKGGIEFRNIPNFPSGTNMSDYLEKDDLDKLVDSNVDIFENIRGQMLDDLNDLPDLAWDAEKFFTTQFWVPMNFTPIDRPTEVPDVIFPKESGDMRVRLVFKHAIDPANWTLVVISIRDALVTITPPAWTVAGNF